MGKYSLWTPKIEEKQKKYKEFQPQTLEIKDKGSKDGNVMKLEPQQNIGKV